MSLCGAKVVNQTYGQNRKMKKENISSIGTVVAAFLAASCCIGPAIFVIFGTSAGFLGKLAFFETYRAYLLGAGFLMLGFSFWKLFLKKADCTCEMEKWLIFERMKK